MLPSSSHAGSSRAVSTAAAAYAVGCYDQMDRELFGALSDANRQWNQSGGPRVAAMLDAITGYVTARAAASLRVVNMSGLLDGKPDPVIIDLLRHRYPSLAIDWTVVDHPRSATITDPTIRKWTDRRGIKLAAQDFRENGTVEVGAADIAICTEVIEHLDYSSTIRLLRSCRAALKPGGMLLLTTPNATYVLHRVMFALGQWDFLHHMDTPEDADRGLLGHIMYYDGKRLARLLDTLGFRAIRTRTFNAGHGPGEYKNILTRIAAIALRLATGVLPHSGQVLLVTAETPS